ncbi:MULTISPECIES: DUF7522 family protein [Halorussus]|uniref:DUF7522 family protein n=1 Tax=Halorussus TaxID=1070314 RepID=UPI00209E2894|nr:hypothetical protein [Halorussus vallis]USZ78115.1 hypothetical protein NGM07_20875 [Halorussus vallis]
MVSAPDELVEFLRERADESLRAVRIYSLDSHRSLYAREDAERWQSEADVEYVVSRAREDLRERADDRRWFTAGELEASVRVFHEAVLVNVVLDDDRGVLVSLDADTASYLHGFVHDCKEWLE